MSNIAKLFFGFLAVLLIADAIPMVSRDDGMEQVIQKRLSNDALIRLLMRSRGAQAEIGGSELKRGFGKRSDLERRSIDDEFSNCFLSPVQCMLPSSRK